ncbi:MAG: GAF domain-containing protein [Anaerolineae bacterium]|nr:GAF domain-containing protein [Anaerolineae bacterium]
MTFLLRNMRSRDDTLTQLRKRYIQALAIFAIIAATGGLIVLLINRPENITPPLFTVIFSLIAYIGVLVLARRGHILLSSVAMIAVFALATVLVPLPWKVFPGMLAIISAATLGNNIIGLLSGIIVLGVMVLDIISLSSQPVEVTSNNVHVNIMGILSIFIVGTATRFFIRQTEVASEGARESAKLLQDVAETGEALAKMLNLKEVLPQSVELIRERFAFYHVQVFLIDETGQSARLAASTGALGQKLFERQHSLPVGSKSVIGQVTSTAKPVVARDTDPIYYRNELLPNTRSELALPIFDGDTVIGALDVQSRREDAFDVENVQALQVLANLLGTSIRNARLFETQERSARETKRLFLETEASLRENQRLNQMLTRQGWSDYMGEQRQTQGVTVAEDMVVSDGEWSDALTQAAQTKQPVSHSNGNRLIAVPVMLGNEVIGAIEVEPSDDTPQAELVEMVRSIAQRLALSLDKARLFEESQQATAREQRINEIVATYQSMSNVEELLKVTVAELGKTLGATRGAIRLGVVEPGNLNGDKPHD